jgi:hypothetical protein
LRAPFPLPVAEYTPDQPDGIGGSDNIVNVYPRTTNSYGPFPSIAAASPAVTFISTVTGAEAVRDVNGNGSIFVGDVTNLYLVDTSANTRTIVSVVDNSYTALDSWRFAQFNNHIVATDYIDAVQDYDLGASVDFAVLAAAAPNAKYIATVKNSFLVLAYTSDATNGVKPQRVWWSAAGDHTSWPTPGTTAAATVQSGATDLLGDGGVIQGIVAGLVNADAVIFQERAVRRMQYTGSPVFSFLPLEDAVGCLCPNSIVAVGGIVYYWSQDGIRAFDGAVSRSIGAGKVDRTIYGAMATNRLEQVVGVVEPLKKMVWWSYRRAASPNSPDRLLGYNWELDRFTHIEITLLDRIIPTVNDNGEYSMAAVTPNTLPTPTSFSLGYFTGAPLAATVETQELEPNPGGNTFVDNCTPLVDGGTPSVSIGYRLRRENSTTYPTATAVNRMGECGVRTSGRFLKARITIPASDTGWSHISGVELGIVKRGRR